jgi:hypothetical protein
MVRLYMRAPTGGRDGRLFAFSELFDVELKGKEFLP